jgi:O-antigen ligase
VPLVVSPHGERVFRVPKALLFRAEGLICAGIVLTMVLFGRFRLDWRRLGREALIALALLTWITASILWASNRAAAAASAATAWLALATIIVTAIAFSGARFSLLHWALLPAVLNATVFLLQKFAGWKPLALAAESEHLASTALLGNPNDVGVTLLLPAVAAVVSAAVVPQRRQRTILAAIGAFLGLTILASQTLTAILGLAVALWVIALRRSRSVTMAMSAGLIVLAAVALTLPGPFRDRARSMSNAAREGRFNDLLSSRLVPFLAASEMIQDRPWTGVGAGGFSSNFFEYKIRVDVKYKSLMPEEPARWSPGRMMSFGEAHNDHLQVAAELGLPGYLLAIALVFAFVRLCRLDPGREADTESRFVDQFRIPAAAALATVAIAQFPLRVAAPLAMIVFYTAICLAWGARCRSSVAA